MDLINIQRRVVDGPGAAALPPGSVVPMISLDAVQLAGGAGAGLGVEGIGVRLQPPDAVGAGHGELVSVVGLAAGNETLPDALSDLFHGVSVRIPGIEVTHHGDRLRPWRPDAVHVAGGPLQGDRVRAHVLIGGDGCSLVEEVGVQLVCFSIGHSDPPVYIRCSDGASAGRDRQRNALYIIPHHFAQRQGGGGQFSMVKATKKRSDSRLFCQRFFAAGEKVCLFSPYFDVVRGVFTGGWADFAERCLLSRVEVLKWEHPNQRRSF